MKNERGFVILGFKEHPKDKTILSVRKDSKEKGLFDISLMTPEFEAGWWKENGLMSKLIDDGNGLVFQSFKPNGTTRTKMRLGYDEAQELRALLKLNDDSGATFKYIKED